MSRGHGETLWALAKCHAEAIRLCWVNEPMPEKAMNPYYREDPLDAKRRFRLLMLMKQC